jgi:hypothetical protein
MRIKLDENMPAALAKALAGLGHDAETVPQESSLCVLGALGGESFHREERQAREDVSFVLEERDQRGSGAATVNED